jgi:potassium-dependent mechanosensitive channel
MESSALDHLFNLGLIWKHTLFTVGDARITIGNLLVASGMLLFSTRLSRWIASSINRRLILPLVLDKSSQNTYQTFAFYFSLILVVTVSLTIAGIPLTVFTVLGGALAIGVGFGSQNIVNNFISGVILLVEKPVKVGDVVELDAIAGTILSIGTRSTKIKTAEGKIFIVPNSFFLEKSVLNWSYGNTLVRTLVNVGVAYGTDVRLVENACIDILLNTEGIKQDPLPLVLFQEFSESTLDFQLNFWCDLEEVSSLAIVRSEVRFKIEQKFRELKIQIAFPQRDVHLKVDKALDVKVLS